MSDHVHLIAVPRLPDGLALACRSAHGRYAAYWNTIHGASGHAWQRAVGSNQFLGLWVGVNSVCPDTGLWLLLRRRFRDRVRRWPVAPLSLLRLARGTNRSDDDGWFINYLINFRSRIRSVTDCFIEPRSCRSLIQERAKNHHNQKTRQIRLRFPCNPQCLSRLSKGILQVANPYFEHRVVLIVPGVCSVYLFRS